VFARRRKPQALWAETRAPERTRETTYTAPQLEYLEEWRRSAKRATRAWNSWLAADHRDRRTRYQAFVSALAEEEQAAARVELIIKPSDMGGCTTSTVTDVANH
jgi:hypothetical protein